jgi:hypothetical protein
MTHDMRRPAASDLLVHVSAVVTDARVVCAALRASDGRLLLATTGCASSI